MGKRVLVTGGTGFLGRHTSVRLKGLGYEVTATGRNQKIGDTLNKNVGVRFLPADLADPAQAFKVVSEQDLVVHCGGLASPWGKYHEFYLANTLATENVARACAQHSIKRLVHISTPSVYFDFKDRTKIKETESLPPTMATHYAETKQLADEAVLRLSKQGLNACLLRPRGIFGPGDKTVLGRVIESMRKGILPLIDGGHSYVDLTYIDNAVDAIVLALENTTADSGRVYNISNGEPLKMRDLVETLSELLDLKARTHSLPFSLGMAVASGMEVFYRVSRRRAEPPLTRYAVGLMSKTQTLDISRARAELGFVPRISVQQGLQLYTRWWKAEADTLDATSQGLLPLSLGLAEATA